MVEMVFASVHTFLSKKHFQGYYCIERKLDLRLVHVFLRLPGIFWLIQLDYVLMSDLFARKTPLSLVLTTDLFDYRLPNEELSLRFYF